MAGCDVAWQDERRGLCTVEAWWGGEEYTQLVEEEIEVALKTA